MTAPTATLQRIIINGWTGTKDNKPDPWAVWIMGRRWVEGCPAHCVSPGMIMLYNFGGIADVAAVETRGNRSTITVRYPDGKEYTSTRGGIVPAQPKVMK